MKPGGQRIKGRAFEQKIARILKYIWPESRRGIQFRDGGKEASDIIGTPYHIECSKGGESIWAKWEQANNDAKLLFPIVIKQRDREEPVVMLSLQQWLELQPSVGGCTTKPCWHDQYRKEFGNL